jgi:FkbM family methyltransferase
MSSRIGLVPKSVDLRGGPLIDVGANQGDWTAAALKVLPSARVIALEPAADSLQRLTQRFGMDPRVTLIGVAASSRNGHAEFHVTGHSHNSSLHEPRDMSSDYDSGWEKQSTVSVATATLDSLLKDESPSLLKIDVQGAELEVLEGASEILVRTSAVLLEVTTRSHYVGDASFSTLHDAMSGSGFALANLSEPFVNPTGEALWFDACYINLNPTP